MRTTVAVLAVLVATLLAPLTIAGTWVTERIDDRDAYVDVVAPLADDPQVRAVLADRAAVAAVTSLQQHVSIGLPDVTWDVVTEWARVAATEVVESPGFPEFWVQANEDLHDQVIDLLSDPDAVADGAVVVDASPLVAQVLLMLEERGIPVGSVPQVELLVPVAQESEVVEHGESYRTIDAAARVLPWLWAGLVALAIIAAHGVRGRVRTAGFALLGIAVGALAVIAAADPIGDAVLERAESVDHDLVDVMLGAVTGSLAPYAERLWPLGLVGLVLVLASLWPRRDREEWPVEDDMHSYA